MGAKFEEAYHNQCFPVLAKSLGVIAICFFHESFSCRQDAILYSTEKIKGEREVNGQLYYDIQIDSPDVQYLATVTVNEGKVYALFVKSPTKVFKADEAALRHVVATFKTI